MRFYNIGHNTAYKRGMPEIYEIVSGITELGKCPLCGVSRREPSGDLKVCLGKTRATAWPDVIACGDYPCFVVSERFVDAMKQAGVRLELGRVDFVGPYESGLSMLEAPQYFWIDGKKHFGGRMDFDASGFVNVRFCKACGVRSDDISATYDRQHANPPPGLFIHYDESKGLDLFTTDLSPTAFFCTEKVYRAAKKGRLKNFRFEPVKQAVSNQVPPVSYGLGELGETK